MSESRLPWSLRLLERLAPPEKREGLVGDLLEERELRAAAVGPRRAGRWLRREVLRSLPHVLRLRLRNDPMSRIRAIFAPMALVLGLLQAWDSGVLSEGPEVISLVATSVAGLLAVLLFARRRAVQVAGLLGCLALLVTARIVADQALKDLFLVAFFPAVLVLILNRLEHRDASARSNGPPTISTPA